MGCHHLIFFSAGKNSKSANKKKLRQQVRERDSVEKRNSLPKENVCTALPTENSLHAF